MEAIRKEPIFAATKPSLTEWKHSQTKGNMKQIEVTDRAFAMIEAYRDEEHTDHIKASLLDAVCGIIDDANDNDTMNSDTLHLLAAISDLNELINELSKTSEQ